MISIRSWLVLAIALAACELEPPPKPAPPAAAPPPTAAATPAPPPTPPPVPPARPATMAPTQPQNPQCLAAAVHFADVTIADARGPTRAQLEHDRTTIVKQTEDACIAQRWSESVIQCFTHAGTAAAIHTCDRELSPPTHATPAAAGGHDEATIEGHAGSGAGSGHRRRSHATRATHPTHPTHPTHGSH